MAAPPFVKLGIPITKKLIQGSPLEQEAQVSVLEDRLKNLEKVAMFLQSVVGSGDDDSSGKVKGICSDAPPAVSVSSSAGTSSRASRCNHTHQGVHSIGKTSALFGDVTLSGAGVTQAGSNFDIPGFAAVFGTPVDVGRANSAGSGTDIARANHVHRGIVRFFGSAATLGNGAGVETDLFSTTIAAATLATDGDAIHFFASGKFGAVASADKQLRIKFGATTIFDSGALSVVSLDWAADGVIVRIGATAQKAWVRVLTGGTTLVFGPVDYTVPAETLSGSVILKLTGAGTNAGDVVGETWMGLWIPG